MHLRLFSIIILKFTFIFLQDRARELADTIGGHALSLAELDTFCPEDGMILANTTSIGMQPKIDETPISKVCILSCSILWKTLNGTLQ